MPGLDLKAEELVADAIYEGLRRNTNALVSGHPAPNESTSIDGEFDLRRVARHVLKKIADESALVRSPSA